MASPSDEEVSTRTDPARPNTPTSTQSHTGKIALRRFHHRGGGEADGLAVGTSTGCPPGGGIADESSSVTAPKVLRAAARTR
jgi:hypothetical protein